MIEPEDTLKPGDAMEHAVAMSPVGEADADDSPKLEVHVFAFLDLLGFSDAMVKSVRKSREASNQLLQEYDRVMDDALKILMRAGSFGLKYRGFTDNFVFAVPLHAGHSESTVGEALNRAAWFQYVLAQHGWFVRGGVCIGESFIDDRLVYGPALIEAYELESKVAREPRVVISGWTLTFIKEFIGYYRDKSEAPGNCKILIDVDGVGFINYLYMPIFVGMPKNEIVFNILNHKTQVEKKLQEFISSPTVWAKYRWVASYHNFFCDNWFPDNVELRIEEEALNFAPRFIIPRMPR